MAGRLAPNKNYYRLQFAGADGVFRDLVWTAWAEPLAMQPTMTDQQVRKDIVGNVITLQPLPKGSIELMNIQSTPLQASPYDLIVNGAQGFTGTNISNTLRQADTSVRQVTLRKTVNLRNIQGASYYQDYNQVEFRFPENVTED